MSGVDVVEVHTDPIGVIEVVTPGPQGPIGPAGTVAVVVGGTPPTSPQVNVIWIDTGSPTP